MSNAIELDRNESRVVVKSFVAVQLPVDHLAELWPKKFRGARIGALLHPASVSSDLEHASRILERANNTYVCRRLRFKNKVGRAEARKRVPPRGKVKQPGPLRARLLLIVR